MKSILLVVCLLVIQSCGPKSCQVEHKVKLRQGNVWQETEYESFDSEDDANEFCDELKSNTDIFSDVICRVTCK
jgi:hypothetical protein